MQLKKIRLRQHLLFMSIQNHHSLYVHQLSATVVPLCTHGDKHYLRGHIHVIYNLWKATTSNGFTIDFDSRN
jgi:hypothetical protein